MRWLSIFAFSLFRAGRRHFFTRPRNQATGTSRPHGAAAAFPGNGDTALTIADGTTVTCPAAVTCIVGNSPAAGNAVLTLAGFGSELKLFSNTAVMKLRGDVSVHAGNAAIYTTVVNVQAGAEWQWDASLASSPSATNYVFAYDNNFGSRAFVASGSSGNHAKIDSNAGGGNGSFPSTLGGKNFAGNYQFSYADVSNIGTASIASFNIDYYLDGSYGLWSAQNSTFTSCGAISTTFRGNNNTFIHDGNITPIGTLSTDLFTGLELQSTANPWNNRHCGD